MTDPDAESPAQDDPPLNRAQRREQARGKGRTSPRRPDNFRMLEENQGQAETVGSADAGETRMTGAGTGGATESAGRVVEHEAKNPEKNQPNS